jgi:hypothetical protein
LSHTECLKAPSSEKNLATNCRQYGRELDIRCVCGNY